MKTSEQIIQGLLDKGYISVSEAMILLKDISTPNIPYNPTITHTEPNWSPFVYCTI